jgi:hypothetical protein
MAPAHLHLGADGVFDPCWRRHQKPDVVRCLHFIVPLFLIFYVLLQHYSGYIELSHFQAKTASVTAYTMLLDFVVDLGVSVLLSRQVVDVGAGGVG